MGVGDRDREREPAAVDLLQRGFRRHPHADLGRRHVVELDGVPDAGLARRQLVAQREHRRLLAETHDPGRGEHVHVARSQGDGSVGFLDDEIDLRRQPGLDWHGR